MSLNIETFAKEIKKALHKNFWVFITVCGYMGSGKSVLETKLGEVIAKELNSPFSYAGNITFDPKEFQSWIMEGDAQKPKYSVIAADELINLFYKRQWYKEGQIETIKLLNRCRVRNLVVIGAVPDFWELDSSLFPIVDYYIEVLRRGDSERNLPTKAIVFMRDSTLGLSGREKWHKKLMTQLHIKNQIHKHPCYIDFLYYHNWTPQQEEEYNRVTEKRKLEVNKEEKRGYVPMKERKLYQRVRQHRNIAIRHLVEHHKYKYQEVSDIFPDLSTMAVAKIVQRDRTLNVEV